MKYREVELLAEKDIAADATEEIALDMREPISKIQFSYKGLNGATGGSDGHPAKYITDITIKDGSDILYSLDGQQCQAVDFYHNNMEPCNRIYYCNGWYNEMVYNLNFGRKLWDKQLALDPSNFSNLQLSISMDIDAGGATSTAGKLKVTASVFDEKKIEPVGFFTHKEHKSYTGGNATHERVDLPVDNAYRMMFWRCQKNEVGLEYLYDRIKLEEDAGKKIPFDLTGWEFGHHIMSNWKPYIERVIGPGTTSTRYFHTTIGWNGTTHPVGWRDGGDCYFTAYYTEGGRFRLTGSAAGPNFQAIIYGWAPHSTVAYAFGDLQDLDDWYDMENVESLVCDTLDLSNGNSQTFYIFSQQFRKY